VEKNPGAIFVIDDFYAGKLVIELREIGLDAYQLKDDVFSSNILVTPNDYLLVFIGENKVQAFNDWAAKGDKDIGTLAFQIRHDGNTGYAPQIACELFHQAFDLRDVHYTNAALAALQIKKTLGLIPEVPDWDTYFMSMVYLVAMRSKDANTHIGAVVVDDKNNIVTTGYNSFPRGIDDDNLERQLRPEKYLWFNHAEENSVAAAAHIGASLKGCRMYTNGVPCMERCAGPIVNSGIVEVIVDKSWNHNNGEKWQQQAERTVELFAKAGVKLRYWEGKTITQIQRYRRGRLITD